MIPNLKKIENNIGADTYDKTKTYAVGEIVIQDGLLYKCKTAITTAEAWNSNHWQATDVLSSAGGNEIAIGSASDITGKTKIFVEESTQRLKYKDSTTGQFEDIAGAEIFVGAEEPTTGEKVWFRIRKNLLNYNKLTDKAKNVGIKIDNNDNVYSSATSDSRDWNYNNSNWYITLLPGTYTISLLYSKQTSSPNGGIGIYSKDKEIVFKGTQNINNYNYTFTLTEKTQIGIMMKIYDGILKIQLESGTVATTPESYIEPQIFVRNSNGVYEEFAKNDNVILYNNVGGSNEDITLNDNSDNYKYIDIYYIQQDNTYSFVRALPNTTVALSALHVTDNGYAIGWAARNIKISGNKITTVTTNRYLSINVISTNSLSGASKTNNIYITKVVGYK